ncbi:MAG: hypothetical protein ABI400_13855, partial [Lacisediminihabitans sp.]
MTLPADTEQEKGTQSLLQQAVKAEDGPASGDARAQQAPDASSRPFRPTGSETLVERAVTKYLASIQGDSTLEPSDIRDSLLQRINGEISLENMGRKGASSPSPSLLKIQVLDEISVVRVLLSRHAIVKIDMTDGNGGADNGVLAIYEESGELEGLYNDSESRIMTLISEFRPSMSF